MKEKLYYFTFFDQDSKISKILQIKAKTFAEAVSPAYIHRAFMNRKNSKSDWDIKSVRSKAI
mgnify:FL=1